MKRKIAVCANGWNYDSLSKALEGIKEYAKKEDFDIFVFSSFASYSAFANLVKGELNIYKLVDPTEYDGVIVFSTMLNSVETAVSLCLDAKEKNVPVVSVGMEIEGVSSVCVSNDGGMRALVEHLVEEHDVKKVLFIGGTEDHVDSIARLNVTREVLKEHGISFGDEDIVYGKWSNRYTANIIDELVDSGKGLPDAIICANDIMAMAACTELENKGYLAPQDVIVTGFDNSSEGKFFYPALSSVEQNYNKIGARACEMIFESIRGNNEVLRETVDSRFVCGESCRCKGDEDYEGIRIDYCRHSFRRNADAKLLEQNERVMRQWMSDVPNYHVMKQTLQVHYRDNHQFEGDGFYIVIDNEYFEDIMASEEELWERGRDSRAELLVGLKNGEIVDDIPVDWRMIVPGYTKNPGEQHVYFIMPLHYLEFNYGYLILTDCPYIMKEDMLYPYLEKLQQSIKIMRINLRLKMLYEKDQMTGLLNRFGYEDKAEPLYRRNLRDGNRTMVMFVDINYMKRINDEFGHLHGDNAIRTVVGAIKDNMGDEGIGVRFGGDEFLIIMPEFDEERAAGFKQSILAELEKRNKENDMPYNISVSIGYVVTDPINRPEAGLQDYIKEADKQMYEIKKEMHKSNDRRR